MLAAGKQITAPFVENNLLCAFFGNGTQKTFYAFLEGVAETDTSSLFPKRLGEKGNFASLVGVRFAV